MRLPITLAVLVTAFLAAPALAQTTPPAADPHAGHDMGAMTPGAPGEKRTMIKISSPEDGEMLTGPPETFTVTFVHPMTLTNVAIVDAKGQSFLVTAKPANTDASSATIALPTLSPGTYTLTWTGVGSGSGRTMTGSIGFMVH